MKPNTPKGALAEQVEQNLEALVTLQRRQWEQRSPSQHTVERLSRVLGRPVFLLALCLFVAAWIAYNVAAPHWQAQPFDPYPFPLLDFILSLAALITTTVVLIAQGLQTKLQKQHTHLALQINLLTEQKVSKVIHLIEELRQDLPMIQNRRDPQAEALKEHTDAGEVLTAIEEVGLTAEGAAADPASIDEKRTAAPERASPDA